MCQALCWALCHLMVNIKAWARLEGDLKGALSRLSSLSILSTL